MSTGICLVLDSQPEFLRNLYNSGKDLIEFDDVLTSIACQLSVTPLTNFISMSRAEAIAEFGGVDFVEDMEAEGELRQGRWFRDEQYLWSVETEWFSASEGLKTVIALLEYIRAEPTCLGGDIEDEEDAEGVLLGLADIQELLTGAKEKQRRFHIMTPA